MRTTSFFYSLFKEPSSFKSLRSKFENLNFKTLTVDLMGIEPMTSTLQM